MAGRQGRARRAWMAAAGAGALALAAALGGCNWPWADQTAISGRVLNAAGGKPEAGVWVIAETASLPTPFRKIVATDDEGRFLVPDLPKGDYHLWVRGYGLKDSAAVDAKPGAEVKLSVASAADAREAARVYPAQYWLSLYEPPAIGALPKTTGAGGQVAPGPLTTRDEWIAQFKLGCMVCHQIGAEITRALSTPQDFETTWHKAGVMSLTADALGREPLKASLVDWERRIAAGETPPPPPRPTGAERNVVITEWQWGAFNSYMHDEIATDKRNPTLYAGGPVWGLDIGTDTLWKLDPKTNRVSSFHVPVRGDYHESWSKSFSSWSAYTWVANPHNPMMDEKGRVWITTQIRDKYKQPTWEAEDLVYQAGFAPPAGGGKATGGAMQTAEGERTDANSSGRQLGYFDTKTEKFVLIDTIYGTHHLQFDAKGRIWTSLDPRGVGMFDPALFDPAHPEETEGRAQKLFLKVDPKTGQSLTGGGYGVAVDPVDQTIWRANPVAIGAGNKLMKYDPRTNTHTDYLLPAPGRGPRGIDFSTDGKAWFATGSGHLGRLDPATGQFTYWVLPGPRLKGTGAETGSAEMPYYVWVDQFDTFGLGKDMVITTGTDSDSLVIFDPKTEKFTVIRVPYPLSFYHRGLDGRIDDPKAGWKGRGLWATYGEDPALFIEGAQRNNLVHIQMRPNPLAR